MSFLLINCWATSQKVYTVQECIDLGIKNTQNTISQESRLQQSIVNQQFGMYSFLPTFNANSGYVYIALENGISLCSMLGNDVEYLTMDYDDNEETFFDSYEEALEFIDRRP